MLTLYLHLKILFMIYALLYKRKLLSIMCSRFSWHSCIIFFFAFSNSDFTKHSPKFNMPLQYNQQSAKEVRYGEWARAPAGIGNSQMLSFVVMQTVMLHLHLNSFIKLLHMIFMCLFPMSGIWINEYETREFSQETNAPLNEFKQKRSSTWSGWPRRTPFESFPLHLGSCPSPVSNFISRFLLMVLPWRINFFKQKFKIQLETFICAKKLILHIFPCIAFSFKCCLLHYERSLWFIAGSSAFFCVCTCWIFDFTFQLICSGRHD